MSTPPTAPRISIPMIPPIKELIKPNTTAVGAYVKNTAQSTAGIALGMIFVAIPWNAGIKSPKIIRTPEYTIATPTAKFIALITANRYGLIEPDRVDTNSEPAAIAAIK